MRFRSLLMILLVISSCGIKDERSGQKEESIKQEFLQKGGEIVNLTQSELLKNVTHAMKTGGPGYAVDFCNMRAMHLKDSLSRMNNCEIRRIALKYRNPLDMPQTKTEKDQLYQYQDAVQKGDSIKPEVYLFDDRIEYYQPIIIDKGTCLVCHGNPGTQITEETFEKIKARYPNDLATGFTMNDFRGAWKIIFLK
jgi:hypothetical protein